MNAEYRDPSRSLESRVEDLLGRMSLDEKLAQLGCIWSTALLRDSRFDPELARAALAHGIGQITRIGGATGLRPRDVAALGNAVQRIAVEETHLGIPVFIHEEAVGGFCARDATVFPQGLGLASTWDPGLVKEVAGIIRQQLMAVGGRLALAPVLDVARDPRWGRVEETYGEDPVMNGIIGSAYIRGLQTADLRHGVAATGKHFLGYAMSEGGRNWNPVHLGPRELREVYAEPFAAAIREAGLEVMMNSYASIDGEPPAGTPAILTGLLRGELGFTGAVVADYNAVAHLHTYHRVAATKGEAARLALDAGLDMELPEWDYYREPLRAEIEAGRVSAATLDEAVRRVLRLKFRLGLFERPYVDEGAVEAIFDTPEQRTVARQAAAESVVVLANDGVLPLRGDVTRVAVIGPGAGDPRVLQGDYHYPAHVEILYIPKGQEAAAREGALVPSGESSEKPGPYYTPHVTVLAGLRKALGGGVELRHAPGCAVEGDDRAGFAEAVDAARGADVAIVVLAGISGLRRPATSGEFNDATDLDLTGPQNALVAELASTGTPLVAVVISGRIHTLDAIAREANALLWCAPPGEEGGNGIADVLMGRVNPSGRLTVSLPRRVGQVPNYLGQRAGGNRPMVFGDYIDSPTSPLFPFGHGLSYTSYEYSDLSIGATDTTSLIRVSLTVRNAGDHSGTDVVQLYARDDYASTARPQQQLLGFARVPLEPGESRRVTFTIHPSRLAFYNPAMRFVTEPGTFTIWAGRSSIDLPLQGTIELHGDITEYLQREIVPTTAQAS
jgi:beta-glucosidase